MPEEAALYIIYIWAIATKETYPDCPRNRCGHSALRQSLSHSLAELLPLQFLRLKVCKELFHSGISDFAGRLVAHIEGAVGWDVEEDQGVTILIRKFPQL